MNVSPVQEPTLTQQEADDLIAMEKERVHKKVYLFPTGGIHLKIPLVSCNREHKFILDINSSRLQIRKYTFQARTKGTISLLRVDINGRPHVNPDMINIGPTHIHRYREGAGDAWAELLPEHFGNPNDIGNILHHFMNECRIIKRPNIKNVSIIRTLFSNDDE